jgi:hypothetical protein
MKRIFVNYPISDVISECFLNDYYESLRKCMDKDKYDFLHSIGNPIKLAHTRRVNQIPIPGWDLGNGNVLSQPTKVCECCKTVFDNKVIVAFSNLVINHTGIKITIVSLNQNDLVASNVNAFDTAIQLFQYDCGYNSQISVNDNVIEWREYISDCPDLPFKTHKFILATSTHLVLSQEDDNNGNEEYDDYINTWPKNNVIHHDENGLKSLILYPTNDTTELLPAIVVCPGGPHSVVPKFEQMPTIVDHLLMNGFVVIYPLRRGVVGLGKNWMKSLIGEYGVLDIQDIVTATKSILVSANYRIDKNRVGLYGGSYGGYNALLIAGKCNDGKLFRAICSHCGVYDLQSYPYECSGEVQAIMTTYGNTTNKLLYNQRISRINPASYVINWNVPVLLVHTLNDTSTWFGQSVKAYNESMILGKQTKLILADGAHSYNIPHGDKLISKICEFFSSTMR